MPDVNLEKVKTEAQELFKKIGKVRFPYLQSEVSFNREGLKHIKFKRDTEARNRDDQFIRLKHIKFAPRILEKSGTLQELRREKGFVRVKTNTRNERVLKWITYYGFVSVINDSGYQKRLKIVVREVEGGQPHFWSLIPHWKRNKELQLFSGNLAED